MIAIRDLTRRRGETEKIKLKSILFGLSSEDRKINLNSSEQ
jgi:hypothetical protein